MSDRSKDRPFRSPIGTAGASTASALWPRIGTNADSYGWPPATVATSFPCSTSSMSGPAGDNRGAQAREGECGMTVDLRTLDPGIVERFGLDRLQIGRAH